MDERPNYEAAIDRIVEILGSARDRPQMYFDPMSHTAVEDFLYGLQTGVSVFGLKWSTDCRRVALESRGLELNACCWESEQLQAQGMTPEMIVRELLAIEIEMWERQRESIRSPPKS